MSTFVSRFASVLAGTALALGIAFAPPPAFAQGASPAAIPQEQLDGLLAPIALYPDQLLTQVLMASTYPIDVVEAARFVKANRELKGDALDAAVAQKPWDPSVQSLTAFPQVLEMMNEKFEWTQQLGDAFLADEARVMQTVQRLRAKAADAGNLKSSEQQKVVVQQQTIVIEPAQPSTVYVPVYNPVHVYGPWWAPAYAPWYWAPPPYYYGGAAIVGGMIGFGIGWAVGANHWGWCHPNWGGNNVNINVTRNNTFIANNAEFRNKAQNGSWQHDPGQRKGVAYANAGTREKFQKVDANAVSARRDYRGYESGANRAGGGRPGAGAGNVAATRPADRAGGPSQGSAGAQRPADRMGGAGGANRASAQPAFNSGMNKAQTQSYASRGAQSRASMSGGSRPAGAGGARGGGGGGGGRGGRGR